MPPQPPSSSCRAMIHSAACRMASARPGRIGAFSYSFKARSSIRKPVPISPPRGPSTALPVRSSTSVNGSGRTGRRVATTVIGTTLCRAQQPQS